MTEITLPVSTALYDPKWFHAFKGENYAFKDKNGVWNGIKFKSIMPTGDGLEDLCWGRDRCNLSPAECGFLRVYKRKLEKLGFNTFLGSIDYLISHSKGIEEVVLLFHEKPDNPCSEREVVKEWFRENGRELEEWKCGR